MDGFVLALFLFAAFLGGFASGLAGFAMGFVVSGMWLHVITPIQTTALIAGYGLCTQGYGVWKLRQTLSWRTVAPFVIGGTIGVPLGAVLLTYLDPRYVRLGVGVLLVIYSAYGLAKPAFKPRKVGTTTDGTVGFLNGVLGGLTGLPGFVITVWCQMRGWTKDEQRAVFQPVILAGMIMIAISLTVAGAITADTLKLYVLGLPALLTGLWLGFKCYGKLDESTFRKVVLIFLLCSGLALIAAQRVPLMRLSSQAVMSTLVPSAFAGPVCRPALSITHAAMSEVQPATMERRWTAAVAADASKCASKAGYFELGFLREKENAALPFEVREQFVWIEPSSLVSIDVWADEAIERAWIDSIQPCPCAGEHR
jgi:uncharacterized membrane protein YfcA